MRRQFGDGRPEPVAFAVPTQNDRCCLWHSFQSWWRKHAE